MRPTDVENAQKEQTMRSIDPSANAVEDIYKLMIGLIVPRPIAFVSTLGPQKIADQSWPITPSHQHGSSEI